MTDGLATNVRPWVTLLANYIAKGQKSGEIQADVDAQAYVTHIMTLILAAIAAGEVLASSLPEDSGSPEPQDRLLSEILRIAKSSLFVTPGRASARPTQ